MVGSVLVGFGDGADGGVDEPVEAGSMVTAVSVETESTEIVALGMVAAMTISAG